MPTPACLATASSETSVPSLANSSAAASSSFSRLRRASARMVLSTVLIGLDPDKPEEPSGYVLQFLSQTEANSVYRLATEGARMSKVWFITGTSKGFGRIWAEAALERGDRVAATARDPQTLQ